MLLDREYETFDEAASALKKHFRPANIEELRGLKFHHHKGEGEPIKKLVISIQELGRKALPSIYHR